MSYSKRKLLSQNFLYNRQLVQRLVRLSSVGKKDIIVEIGAGNGIVTRELTQKAGRVISYEIDPVLHSNLSRNLKHPNLSLVCADFLKVDLPLGKYKVFSNVPFSITGEVIRKLLLSQNGPEEAWLIVQKEAAQKFIANDTYNTMAAILYYPWWEISIHSDLHPHDFSPQPKVLPVVLRIKQREQPLLSTEQKNDYQDFVAYSFNKIRGSSRTKPNQWLDFFKTNNTSTTRGSYTKLEKEQAKLKKVHRTRLDTNWRSFSDPTS